jgi:hypothetical protein
MPNTRKNAVRLAVAFNEKSGEYYCVDQRRGLHLVSAATIDALHSKLQIIFREDFAGDPNVRVVLQFERAPSPPSPSTLLFRG